MVQEQKEISNYEKVEKYLSEIYLFRYNVVSNIIEFKKEQDPEYTIANEDNIYRLLQHNKVPFSLANIRSLLRSDFVPLYNPFLEYYESMPLWTSQDPDYITELANYIVAVDQSQFNIHFKKMLVRTVVCSLDEDYFNKQAFILVQPKQNSGKSTFCRFLCPPRLKNYIAENTDSADNSGQMMQVVSRPRTIFTEQRRKESFPESHFPFIKGFNYSSAHFGAVSDVLNYLAAYQIEIQRFSQPSGDFTSSGSRLSRNSDYRPSFETFCFEPLL